ncbi:hypothetical protein CBS147347_7572 [Aspergillus niger]|nr:hypothetical protein CBS147371_10019 [Aspergillus niger]KAI2982684.1 hypothetical protein CBS147344_8486 [Aspergillus niger]KAI3022013.1 hypothetical protein CBS147347_7572 [Aspergillus niger]
MEGYTTASTWLRFQPKFPEYTERDAEMQLRRLPSRIPKTVKEVRDELDWFPNELRVFHRIDASCTSSQRIYFPEFHGVINDLKKYLGSPYAKHRAIALECIRPKLSSRRILAAHKEHSHGDKFKDKLSGLGSLSDFEVDYYDSLFTDRIRRLLTLHRLGITHGDIKDEHFRLPMDFFDTVLYDFSHSYTFSPVKPYLLSFSLPRPLKNISRYEQTMVESQVFERAEKLDLREHLVETIGATQSVIMDALIQPLQEELLELIILRRAGQDRNYYVPSVSFQVFSTVSFIPLALSFPAVEASNDVRCLQSGRICLGYRSNDELRFRHYVVPANKPVQLLFPPQSRIVTTNDPVGLFLDQYVVCSRDSRVSRGFLDGLPSLLASVHPSSDLVRAVEIVAWATLGNKISRPDLLARARRQYTGLLCSFQDLLHCCQLRAPTVEALVIAILLGLYEIVSSDEITQEQQKHVAHVRGVCALLLSPNSPFDLLSSTQLFQVANPLLIKRDLQVQDNRGVLCAPASNHAVHNLDSILIKCHPLFEHANTQLQDPLASFYELQKTLDRALAIELAFSQWGATQDVSWKADIVGFMSQQDAEASSCPFAWGGPVHAYFDIYVAAVMNTYRKTYLMLLDVLIRLASRMGGSIQTDNVIRWEKQAHILIYDIVASIPYHLTNNLHAYQQDILSLNSPPGGYTSLPFQETAEGHVLIWAGMLLHPAEKQTQL